MSQRPLLFLLCLSVVSCTSLAEDTWWKAETPRIVSSATSSNEPDSLVEVSGSRRLIVPGLAWATVFPAVQEHGVVEFPSESGGVLRLSTVAPDSASITLIGDWLLFSLADFVCQETPRMMRQKAILTQRFEQVVLESHLEMDTSCEVDTPSADLSDRLASHATLGLQRRVQY